jgi:putative chitinase
MNQDQFRKAANISAALAQRWFLHMQAAMTEFGIDTPLRQSGFISQIFVESGGFQHLEESLNYSIAGLAIFGSRLTMAQREQLGRKVGESALSPARQAAIANLVYGGRYGNNLINDGWLYRGRGLKQVTFKSNYIACGKVLNLPLEEHPELLSADENAARSAGWFWKANGCNAYADIRDVVGLTRKINGGSNGLSERQVAFKHASGVLCV